MRGSVFQQIIEKKLSFNAGLKLLGMLKMASQVNQVLAYLLLGKNWKSEEWDALRLKFPNALGNPRINTLLMGGGVTMAKLRFRKTASDYVKERAALIFKIPQSFIQVINEVELAQKAEEQHLKLSQDDSAIRIMSPNAQSCKVWFVQADCVNNDVFRQIPQGKYKGFTASVNFGLNQYAGDETPTTIGEVDMLLRGAHYLTSADEYFVLIACRAADREGVYTAMQTSVVSTRVIHVQRLVWHKTNMAVGGFRNWPYDTEDMVIGYFRKADEGDARPASLFSFASSSRSSVLSFPRGTPFRDKDAQGESKVLVSSVWNIDMLLSLLGTCLERGDTICDMFAGTASATVAAVLLGCNSVVVEKDPRHLSLCRKRINTFQNKMATNMTKYHNLAEEKKTKLVVSDVSSCTLL